MPFTDKLTQLYNGQGFVRASEYLLASSNGPMPCAMLLAIEVGNLKVIEHALARAKKIKPSAEGVVVCDESNTSSRF